MAKFTTDYVNLIANNLRDRYKAGFPILKELLQNADDAGATSVAFGYHDGFANLAVHELLQGPALWVINDGRFRAEDRQAIKAFGLNSKAGEAGAIGKFGLGMKSVFHLCEAFFYVASDGSEQFHEILSPWFQEDGSYAKHTAWETMEKNDVLAIDAVARGQSLVRRDRSWFMLWIPLRRRSHVPSLDGEATAPIIDRFPGDEAGRDLDFFSESGIDRRIGQILPLLRNLQRIEFSGTSLLPPFDLRLDLAESGKRLDHVSEGSISGSVDDGGTKGQRLRFLGVQTLRTGMEPFVRLQADAAWPKSNAIVGGGKRGPVPDKAQPEGAVMISHADGRRGHMSLQWAVFLPTEEQRFRFEAPIPNSSREYAVTLHGQFFVDSGRRGIEGMERLSGDASADGKGDASIQVEWNKALARDVVLPMVLPTLAEHARRERFSDEHISALTDAFVRCRTSGDAGGGASFTAMHSRDLHREHVWVRILRRTGAAWELQPVTSRLRLLPRPVDSDQERPWRAMPGLGHLDRTVFVDASAPRISPPVDHWDEEDVCLALDRLPAATLCSESALKYLLEFLAMHRQLALNTERVQLHLVSQVRSALHGCALADLRAQRQLFRELLALLPNELWYGIGTRTADAKGAVPEYLYKHLCAANTRALLVPADLAPDGEQGRPPTADIEAWLYATGVMAARNIEVARCLEVAEGLIGSVGTDREKQADLVRRHPRLRILRAFDVHGNDEIATSLDDLLGAHERSCLFRNVDVRDRLGLTKELAACAPALPLFVVRAAPAFYVQSASPATARDIPATNDAAGMFKCIGTQPAPPALGAPVRRQGLLNHVGGIDNLGDPAVRRGVRYLLHGDPVHFDSHEPLWKDPSGVSSPWVRLWRMMASESWNILPGELSEPVPDKCSKVLDIRIVDQSNVIGRLKAQASFESVDAATFTQREIDAILGGLEDENAWRRLPLHLDTQGRFGPVDGFCHLGCDPALPATFPTAGRFIVAALDEAHLRRQQRLIAPWTSATAAAEILSSGQADAYWRELMHLLSASSAATIGKQWHEVPWLPLRDGRTISPASLLRLDGMEAEIGALAAACQFAWAGVGELHAEVGLHPAFESLLALVPTGVRALPALAQLMTNAGLSIGRHGADPAMHAERHLATLAGLKSLPAWNLAARAAGATSAAEVAVHLLPDIALQLDRTSAERLLSELASQPLVSVPRAIIHAALREWAGSAADSELLPALAGLRLPAADGRWRPAGQLAHGAFGVAAEHLIDPQVGEILSGIIVSNYASLHGLPDVVFGDGDGVIEDRALEMALDDWAGSLLVGGIGPALGALIGLFGEGARELAERAMAPISYDDYLLKLDWKDPGYDNGPSPRLRWMGGNDSPLRPFTLLKPVFIVAKGSGVNGLSLTGRKIELPLADGDAMTTLLAGPVRWLGGYGVEIRMRPLDCFGAFDRERQKGLLQQTAEGLLDTLYSQSHANLSELWKLFDKADQVELAVARSMILEGLPQLMQQLSGVKHHPLIGSALAVIGKARRDIASAEQANSNVQVPRDRYRIGLRELQRLVETDASVQNAVLAAIRGKVERYQYESSSIPFELLQNADDAVVEYQAMQHAEGRSAFSDDDIGRFVAMSSDQGLVMVHWGRPINHTGKHGGYRSDFEQDLERMLTLGASGKEPENGVTGRFGLGFKSVLLATDCPVIESGDLRFDILAGCLPRPAPLSHSARAVASRFQQGALRPTIVELPLAVEPAALLGRFRALASMCTVFSRRIRHLTVDSQVFKWRPERVLEHGDAWCEIGQVQLPRKDAVVPAHVLTLRCAKGDAVVRLDGMPVRFDQDAEHAVPAVWIHAPTRGTAASGLVLNAEFDVDTGRGSLPHGKAAQRNLDLAMGIADDLAAMLAELIERSAADWAHWSGLLAAAPRTPVPGFWHAFWSVTLVDQPDANASQDAQIVAAHAARLFDMVSARTGVVPNGLPGDLGAFAALADIRLAIRCERLLPVLPELQRWPSFIAMHPVRCWCSLEVGGWLTARSGVSETPGIVELDRAVLLAALGPDKRLAPEDVGAIAAIIRAWPQGPTEVQGWRNELGSVHLRTKDSNWKPMQALYLPLEVRNDPLARFVPDDLLLDEAYEQHPGDWLALRSYFSLKTFNFADVASWLLAASLEDSRRAVIDWLSRNLDNVWIWDALRARVGGGSWIFDLDFGHELLDALAAETRALILKRLELGDIDESNDDDAEVMVGELDLQMVHRWWSARREVHLARYNSALWPQRVDRMRLNHEIVDREAWMTLFSLGIFKRFGRVRDEQNRGFLDFLHEHGWWETISQVDPDGGAEAWMAILREYAEASQVVGTFERWMDSFASLYRVARWCNEYVQLFQNLSLRSEREAAHLLTPAEDASLSGSGFDAPTLHRTLHIGHNLVIRELLRAGVLQPGVAERMAFMPGNAVRELLAGMGHTDLESSEEIHDLLVDEFGSPELASFGGDYDIPLIMLALDPALREEAQAWADVADPDDWDEEEAA